MASFNDILPKDCKNEIFSYLRNYERILAPVCKEWNTFFSAKQKEREDQVLESKKIERKQKKLVKQAVYDLHADQLLSVLEDLISLKKLDSFIEMVFGDDDLPWCFDESAFFLNLIELDCLDQIKRLHRKNRLVITNMIIPLFVIDVGHFTLFKWVMINFANYLRWVDVDGYLHRYTHREEMKAWMKKFNAWYHSNSESDFEDSENEELIQRVQVNTNHFHEESDDEDQEQSDSEDDIKNEQNTQPQKKQKI